MRSLQRFTATAAIGFFALLSEDPEPPIVSFQDESTGDLTTVIIIYNVVLPEAHKAPFDPGCILI